MGWKLGSGITITSEPYYFSCRPHVLRIANKLLVACRAEYICKRRKGISSISSYVDTKKIEKERWGIQLTKSDRGLELKKASLEARIERASLVAQMVKNLPAMQETWIQSLSWEGPLEKGMATHSSILAWRIPWTEEPGGILSMQLQRLRHDWETNIFTFVYTVVSIQETPKIYKKGCTDREKKALKKASIMAWEQRRWKEVSEGWRNPQLL